MSSEPLCLDLIHLRRREEAVDALDRGDVSHFLRTFELSNEYHLRIVAANIQPLRARGLYEMALYTAYISTRTDFSNWPLATLRSLFQIADRSRLRAAGDPIPGRGAFSVFRGVAGNGASRRVKGLSWTLSLEKAKWFAQRKQLMSSPPPDPAVFELVVEEDDVLFYSNERQEQEVVLLVPPAKPVRVWRAKDELLNRTR